METIEYRGYRGTVETCEPDNYHYGHVLGLKRDGIIYEGENREAMLRDFHEAVDDYLAYRHLDGEQPEIPFYGNVDIDEELRQPVENAANKAGKTVKEFINQLVRASLTNAALL